MIKWKKIICLCLPELELFSGDLDDSLNFLLFFGSGDFEGLLRFLGDGDFEGLLWLLASSRWCFSVRAKCLLSLQNIRGGRVSSTQQKLFCYKGEIEMPPVFWNTKITAHRLLLIWRFDETLKPKPECYMASDLSLKIQCWIDWLIVAW